MPNTSTAQISNEPPENDEIELVFFGNGFGEAILIHAGNNSWYTVDSCKTPEGEVAQLQYLDSIGISPTSIKQVIATHWDTDHISGISEILESTSDADFIISSALEDDTFHSLVWSSPLSTLHDSYLRLNKRLPNAISEFLDCYKVHMEKRKKHIRYAARDQRLCIERHSGGNAVELISLSPHESIYSKAIDSIISQIPSGAYPAGSIKAPKPNLTSIVLCLRTEDFSVLLGADLEECSQHKGWTLILDESTYNGDFRADVFKVAHHGSETGHHDEIYSKLLSTDPKCVISPFNRNPKLPKLSDIDRIERYSDEIYLTTSDYAKPVQSKSKHTSRAYRKRNVTKLFSDVSFVRMRRKLDADEWQVNYVKPACRVDQTTKDQIFA